MSYDSFSQVIKDTATKALVSSGTAMQINYSDALVFAVCQYAALYPDKFKEMISQDQFANN
jgi:hypothetical protein